MWSKMISYPTEEYFYMAVVASVKHVTCELCLKRLDKQEL